MIDLLSNHLVTILLFLIIAILYSSVGFGGGSSYLAVLALTGIAYTQIRSTALLCNIMVVTSNVILFQKEHIYNWKKILPLIFLSVPMAFIGGYLKINQTFFFLLLGVTLLFAAITMWILKKQPTEKTTLTKLNQYKNASYGGIIGLISGMVGIGGGIFLAPLLHLTNWDTSKKIAATSSLFILVNSISGLIGQAINPNFFIDWKLTSILLIVVFIGGQIGYKLRDKLLNPILLKKATAILIAFVSIRILLKYF
ncbi:sulfite exporter TauE/SafE family protein [Tenacibaculum sp.]|nr:sulfite exporter TauE/SafE family protein [Tenacibaculum sp.]